MGLFSRLFTWGKSEANAALDNMEDPVKMTEQGIRDLKKDLEETLKGLAEVKSLAIRAKRESNEKRELALDYEKKAMLLLSRAQEGQLDASTGDRLASEALTKKETYAKEAAIFTQNQSQHDGMVQKLESNVKHLKSQINTWENELSTLKARAKVANVTEKLNKQLAHTDTSGTISMLEKMKNRVEEKEALAESYGEIAGMSTSVDDEINKALAGSTSSSASSLPASDSLADLKKKMGLNN